VPAANPSSEYRCTGNRGAAVAGSIAGYVSAIHKFVVKKKNIGKCTIYSKRLYFIRNSRISNFCA
jgi:hypothetical protein